MKKMIFTLCFLFVGTGAFAQLAAVQGAAAQPLQMADHPQHASEHAMAPESSLLSNSVYSFAKGEVPLAELGSIEYQTPLGDVARAFRKERLTANYPKAVKVLEK